MIINITLCAHYPRQRCRFKIYFFKLHLLYTTSHVTEICYLLSVPLDKHYISWPSAFHVGRFAVMMRIISLNESITLGRSPIQYVLSEAFSKT